MTNEELIREAKVRGYRKGTLIQYVPWIVDRVEGNYFEVENGKVKAYAKPKHQRKSFDDRRHDTLFDGKEWVKIVSTTTPSDDVAAGHGAC